MPTERKAVLTAFDEMDVEELTVSEVMDATGVSRHTAEKIMRQLERLGIMQFHQAGNGRPAHLSPVKGWKWCIEEPFVSVLHGTEDLAPIGG
jgi:hypothetical protein